MKAISRQVELIREFLLKKPVADKPVASYSPFLSDKENITSNITGITTGMGANTFSALSPYTYEQDYASLLNAYDYIAKVGFAQ